MEIIKIYHFGGKSKKVENNKIDIQAINAFRKIFEQLQVLRDKGILINKKDLNCQIGEWLIEIIYGGRRAINPNQPGWDVEVIGKHIQVKTHAKSSTNKARKTMVSFSSSEQIDELIVIVFSHDYRLKEFYKVPWTVIKNRAGIDRQSTWISWKSIAEYRIDISDLPRQDIISLFG